MQKAAVLTEALPYIQDFCGSTVLVKVGGSVMESETNLVSLLADIAFMDAVGMKVVIVHGGGKAISRALKESGIEPKFVDGLRVTDGPTMEIVRRTLNTEVNASLVHLLQGMKANARPLHGNWMFTAEKITTPDRGYVGEPVAVDTRAVCEMLDAGIIPVVTPLGKVSIPMGELIDREKELARLTKEKEACEKEVAIFEKKLANEQFVSRAPEAVVEAERQKAQKTRDLIAQLEQSEAAMKKLSN